MTHEEFISLLKQPDTVAAEDVSGLKEIVDIYPYFSPARLFHAKALQRANSVLFSANLKFSSVYSTNRRWLYYYIHPDKKISTEPYKREKPTKSSGDYFDMINAVEAEGGDSKQSLKTLAERLKSARAMVSSVTKTIPAITPEIVVPKPEPVEYTPVDIPAKTVAEFRLENVVSVSKPDITEDNAKKLIREHKYVEAIEILKELNLNNPKKSIYFADQIRFLEKVIANSKK